VNWAPRYLALSEALSVHLVTVTEISESGSVPNLKVIKRGNVPVLLLDGEELIGAKDVDQLVSVFPARCLGVSLPARDQSLRNS